jgi:hypothetical protein
MIFDPPTSFSAGAARHRHDRRVRCSAYKHLFSTVFVDTNEPTKKHKIRTMFARSRSLKLQQKKL